MADGRETLRGRISEAGQHTDGEPERRRDRWKLWRLVVWWVAPTLVALAVWFSSDPEWAMGKDLVPPLGVEAPGTRGSFDLDPYQ